jgi:hypothetical protein
LRFESGSHVFCPSKPCHLIRYSGLPFIIRFYKISSTVNSLESSELIDICDIVIVIRPQLHSTYMAQTKSPESIGLINVLLRVREVSEIWSNYSHIMHSDQQALSHVSKPNVPIILNPLIHIFINHGHGFEGQRANHDQEPRG